MNKQKDKRTSIILCAIMIIPVIWAAVIAAPYLSNGQGLVGFIQGFTDGINNPLSLSWTEDTLKTVLLFLLIYAMGIGIYFSMKRNYRRQEEHGSAKWGNPKQLNRKYANKDFFANIILTKHVRLGLDGHVHKRNNTAIVVGGSGSGKTRAHCLPNIMNAQDLSYVCLDPKGEILRNTGHLLERQGYQVRVLDLINMERSHSYNPFAYLRTEADVLKLVTNLIRNTTPKGSQSNDPFWERAEQALLSALILYLVLEAPPHEQCFPVIMEMIGAADAKEDDEEYQSVLDELFDRLAMRDPENLAVKQYGLYKKAGGRTAKSILISLAVRLEKFNLPSLARLVTGDELHLPSIGEKKVALFVVIPDNDSSLNFLVGMMYTQIFQELFLLADTKYNGQLPQPVHLILDEFANCALPDEFQKIVSVARSRRVSMSIILQNMSQIRALYEKDWESIVGNADSFVYLGGNERATRS